MLEDVKNHLDITWDDEPMERKLLELISAGMYYIGGKLGEEADFTSTGLPRTLLFEFVRYARDGAMDIFEANYQHMLLAMQHERMVQHAQDTNAAQQ